MKYITLSFDPLITRYMAAEEKQKTDDWIKQVENTVNNNFDHEKFLKDLALHIFLGKEFIINYKSYLKDKGANHPKG